MKIVVISPVKALAEGKSTLETTQELIDEEGTVVAVAQARYVLLKMS